MSSLSIGKSKTGELIDQLAGYVRTHGGWNLPKGLHVRAVTHGVRSYRCLPEVSTPELLHVLVKWADAADHQKGSVFTIDVDGYMSTRERVPVSYNAEAMAHELLDIIGRVDALSIRETELSLDGLPTGGPHDFIDVDRLEALTELPGMLWKSVHAMQGFLGPRLWVFTWGVVVESNASSDAYLIALEMPLKKTKEEIAHMSDHELDVYLRSLSSTDRIAHPATRMGGGMVERISLEHGISDLRAAIARHT